MESNLHVHVRVRSSCVLGRAPVVVLAVACYSTGRRGNLPTMWDAMRICRTYAMASAVRSAQIHSSLPVLAIPRRHVRYYYCHATYVRVPSHARVVIEHIRGLHGHFLVTSRDKLAWQDERSATSSPAEHARHRFFSKFPGDGSVPTRSGCCIISLRRLTDAEPTQGVGVI